MTVDHETAVKLSKKSLLLPFSNLNNLAGINTLIWCTEIIGFSFIK